MFKKNQLRPITLAILVLLCTLIGKWTNAQPAISGASCIIPGTTYQYIISGPWDSTSNARICLTGGALDGGDSCINFASSSYSILVIWRDSVAMQEIDVTSDTGVVTLNITATSELQGGNINDTDMIQQYSSDQVMYTYHCSDPTGGSCTPQYQYQWQSSSDQFIWENVSGATSADLNYSGPVVRDIYFRRVTKELDSNILAYSDHAVLVMGFE